jgi:hypothetical protein
MGTDEHKYEKETAKALADGHHFRMGRLGTDIQHSTPIELLPRQECVTRRDQT